MIAMLTRDEMKRRFAAAAMSEPARTCPACGKAISVTLELCTDCRVTATNREAGTPQAEPSQVKHRRGGRPTIFQGVIPHRRTYGERLAEGFSMLLGGAG